MKDKYFLLNGRSYPDTVAVTCGANGDGFSAARIWLRGWWCRAQWNSIDGRYQPCLAAAADVINIPANGHALAAHLGPRRQ